jgi:hypothetical protein
VVCPSGRTLNRITLRLPGASTRARAARASLRAPLVPSFSPPVKESQHHGMCFVFCFESVSLGRIPASQGLAWAYRPPPLPPPPPPDASACDPALSIPTPRRPAHILGDLRSVGGADRRESRGARAAGAGRPTASGPPKVWGDIVQWWGAPQRARERLVVHTAGGATWAICARMNVLRERMALVYSLDSGSDRSMGPTRALGRIAGGDQNRHGRDPGPRSVRGRRRGRGARRRVGPDPPRRGRPNTLSVTPTVSRFCMALLFGRAGLGGPSRWFQCRPDQVATSCARLRVATLDTCLLHR